MLARAWRLVSVPIVAVGLSLLIGGYDRLLSFFEDDASYYFLIAENIVETGRSTFDGRTLTTGYHPLWLLVNVALSWLAGSREVWLSALVVVCAVLALLQAALLHRLLIRLAPASPLLVGACVVLVSAWSLRFSFSGMECALVTPLLVGCALELLRHLEEAEPSSASALRLGLLSAGAGLSRVDALLFGLACGATALCLRRAPWNRALRRASFYALGLTPFAIYLGINLWMTGSLLTTSAQAKSLSPVLAWNFAIFENINRAGQVALVVSALGALLVASRVSPFRGPARAVALVSFAFPAFYYATLAVRSSWNIWSWYLYPIPLSLAVSLVAGGEAARRALEGRGRSVPSWVGEGGLLAALGLSLLIAFRIAVDTGNNEGARDSARELARFAERHSGYYAMGDRAGVTALLVPMAFLQLEGLVSDQSLLEDIRRQRPLREVLHERGVDYLVEAVPNHLVTGRCLEVTEPKPGQAGELSPKMAGTFCDPVARIPDKLGWVTTLVYALK